MWRKNANDIFNIKKLLFLFVLFEKNFFYKNILNALFASDFEKFFFIRREKKSWISREIKQRIDIFHRKSSNKAALFQQVRFKGIQCPSNILDWVKNIFYCEFYRGSIDRVFDRFSEILE